MKDDASDDPLNNALVIVGASDVNRDGGERRESGFKHTKRVFDLDTRRGEVAIESTAAGPVAKRLAVRYDQPGLISCHSTLIQHIPP